MVNDPFQLAEVLGTYVTRSGYTTGQLAKLSGIPKPTIVNWLEGRVKRPRSPQDLLRLAAVLHLSRSEATHLLQTAVHPTIDELETSARQTGDSDMLTLLSPWQETAVSPQKPTPSPFQAMAEIPTFVGRETEIEALTKVLTAASHQTLYAIQGMGGVGKTALAVHIAYLLRDYFPDGVLWARIDTSDTLSILSTFARAFGLDVGQYSDISSRSRVVRDLLAHKRVLIVLDSVDSSEHVKPLLPPTGSSAVLITTRRHDLSVLRGAWRLVLRPFAPELGEAMTLFQRVLGDRRFATEKSLLAELADLLGHLPLAVDIAAARLAYEPGWSTAEFVRRVRQGQRRLGELSFEDQSIHLSFTTSYDLLTPDERHCFAALSIFPGDDFSDEAVAVVAELSRDDARDLLRRLYALSLIQPGRPAPHHTRYRLHRLLRDYAREQLGDETAVLQRMVTYYVNYAAANHRRTGQLALDMANIQAALTHAADLGMEAALVRGSNAFYYFLEANGQDQLAADTLQQTLAAAKLLGDGAALLATHHNLGRLALRQGEYIEAETQLEAALSLARELDDTAQLSHLLRTLGVLAARRGDYVLADAYYKEGLGLAREFGRGNDTSNFLRGLGVQAYMRGDFARAEAFYEEGLALMQAEDSVTTSSATTQESAAALLWGLGALAEEHGDTSEAEGYYREALALVQQVGHLERVIVLLRHLGSLYYELGDLDKAAEIYGEARARAEEIGHRWQMARLAGEWGELQLALGELPPAEAAFNRLYNLARIMQSQELVAVAQFGLARLAAARGEAAQALRYGREALDTFTAIGHAKVQDVRDWLTDASD